MGRWGVEGRWGSGEMGEWRMCRGTKFWSSCLGFNSPMLLNKLLRDSERVLGEGKRRKKNLRNKYKNFLSCLVFNVEDCP